MATTDPRVIPRVVVGIDGSQQSKLALQWAENIARSVGGSVDVVAAWEHPTNFDGSFVPSDGSPRDHVETIVTETLHEVFGAHPPPDSNMIICEGHPVTVLLEKSDSALMLIVGSRGRGGFAGLLLGSVAATVAEHATCPVLVVHGDRPPAPGSLAPGAVT